MTNGEIICHCGALFNHFQIKIDHRDVYYPATWIITTQFTCANGHKTELEPSTDDQPTYTFT